MSDLVGNLEDRFSCDAVNKNWLRCGKAGNGSDDDL